MSALDLKQFDKLSAGEVALLRRDVRKQVEADRKARVTAALVRVVRSRAFA